MALTAFEKQLLNDFQHDFPLERRPYRAIAERLGVSEQAVLEAMQALHNQNLVHRIGSIIQVNKIGKSMLAAMAVPTSALTEVAEIINQFQEVNHNYERENSLNLWFVLIGENQSHLDAVVADIEQQTGFPVLQFPLLKDYFIDLGFELDLSDG